MKRSEIIYHPTYTATPLSFWVHRNLDHEIWAKARTFEPPLPSPVPGKGWPMLAVEYDGLTLSFASAQELHHFLLVIGRNPMPTPQELGKARGTTLGPDRHWLSGLPPEATSVETRRALFEWLVAIAPDFVAVG